MDSINISSLIEVVKLIYFPEAFFVGVFFVAVFFAGAFLTGALVCVFAGFFLSAATSSPAASVFFFG